MPITNPAGPAARKRLVAALVAALAAGPSAAVAASESEPAVRCAGQASHGTAQNVPRPVPAENVRLASVHGPPRGELSQRSQLAQAEPRRRPAASRRRGPATTAPRVGPVLPAPRGRGGGPRPSTECTGADRASDGSCVAPDLAPNAPQRQLRPQPGQASPAVEGHSAQRDTGGAPPVR